ncbi:hypothetical protein C0Q70_08064 [Pomacea canaliculata]|uniref:L-Fucosyltransferase n=2 Tax=Pomacea canaliculata TaxID=400727 RepID=A0A2T7PGT3_POMCA|nr:uncharacterized protein LOC112561731 isoform X3 [Pomacea canaliculata]XP_025090162.1 uncharacterized protein LOC112561731 isoform X3 [Pomacea canaliculata]XP_025090163.1 uncharacterized protein LOC112561731 isoform X3 [Pomacea canaliculata]XP_025090164.1 uncharacterized protein LOC112561731 isoform X3 [Pomacea canaliculata]PVD32621.1 hypothetical protein C0Q70_08064 [Pomacea canaliculata]
MLGFKFLTLQKRKFLLVIVVVASVNVIAFFAIGLKITLQKANKGSIEYRQLHPDEQKVLVYHCPWDVKCGGLGDRQKGIVGGFVLSAMLNRTFKIHMPLHPECNLDFFLTPSELDWRVRSTELAHPDQQSLLAMDGDNIDVIQSLLKKDNLQAELPSTYVLFRSNMEIVQYLLQHPAAKKVEWLQGKSVPDIYKEVITRLFTPSERIQKKLQKLQSDFRAGNASLICAQVRLGQSETFEDTEQFLNVQVFPVLADFLAPYSTAATSRIFISSDSKKIVELATARFPTVAVTVPGPITHVDRSKGGDTCEGTEKAVVEQFLLASCDMLVISESGFAKIAAFLRGRDDGLYIVYNKATFFSHKIVVESYRRDEPAFPNRRW